MINLSFLSSLNKITICLFFYKVFKVVFLIDTFYYLINIHKGNIGVQTNNKVLNCLQKHTLSHKYNKFYSISRLFINSTITNNIIKKLSKEIFV